ncbi:MAG: NAD(P)-dependent oxidoreductase [Persephonella sp.]|nr:NAD(P)-dependent oxidoreductase [Persephonella sp.]
MALFPMFVSLEGKKVLVVGGGTVALRKIEKLLPFKPEIKVISKRFFRRDTESYKKT